MKIYNMNAVMPPIGDMPNISISAPHNFHVGLTRQGDLTLFDMETTIVLGLFNKRQVDKLCEYLQDLKIHLPA